MPTPIDTLYQQQKDLLDYLRDQKELSHHATASVLFQKTLLLGVASYFEHAISDIVVRFLNHYGHGHEAIVAFAKRKGVDRQYHTYFGWDGNNANSFFALFGPTFLARSKEEVKRSPDLNSAIRAFLDLGNSRNELVHLNFVTFAIEKTADEIYALYKTAVPFIAWLEQALGLEVADAGPADAAAAQTPSERVTKDEGAEAKLRPEPSLRESSVAELGAEADRQQLFQGEAVEAATELQEDVSAAFETAPAPTQASPADTEQPGGGSNGEA